MDERRIGKNLLRFRLDKELTQDKIAEMAGITRLAYQNIENGLSTPRPSTLQNLAAALDVKLVDLFASPRELKHVRFRALKKMRSRKNILIEVGKWLDNYNYLEDILEEKKDYQFSRFQDLLPKKLTGAERARHAACLARKKLGLEDSAPIRDLAGLLEDNGIKLYPYKSASEGFFGLSVAESDGGPAIVVNVSERISVERWIFSAAHELGHLLLHLDSYDVNQGREDSDQEKEANIFASFFLMPEKPFLSEWHEASGLDLVDRVLKIKSIFNVSYKTVLYRVSESIGQTIWPRFNNAYKRKYKTSLKGTDEPFAMDPSSFTCDPVALRSHEFEPMSRSGFIEDRLSRLVRLAVENAKISLGRAAEILGYELAKMREVASFWV